MRRALAGIAAIGLGAVSATALAPLHAGLAGFIGFGGLFLLLERSRTRRGAAALGWCFGLGAFLLGLSWVTEAFSVDPERFGALALPALLALAGGLAVFPALAVAAARMLAGQRGGIALALALAACWATLEWLRGMVLTGFPWNIAGYAWGAAEPGLQLAALAGIHGLGLITLLAWVLPAAAWSERRVWPALLAAALVAMPWAWGTMQLAAALPPDVPGVRLRLVQPNIAQDLKWAEGERERILARLLALSTRPGDPTHVIWPESAVPYLIAEAAAVRAAMATAVPPGGTLLTGAVRRARTADGRPALLNSLVALDGAGEIVAAYDKINLVPFGEYQPLRAVFAALPKLTVGEIDFIPGSPRAALPVAGLPPAWPLICYEAIFPSSLADRGETPGWILNVTNDAWFGTSWGPYQHALAARVRGIELGLPLVRVANSGITMVTDARGQDRARLPLSVDGVIDTALPGALPGGTVYARWGDWPFGVALLLLAGIVLAMRRCA
jgi:apolipoprotein N-acyltransferase